MSVKKTISIASAPDIWEQAKRKASPVALSRVIVQLLKMWIAGLIDIDWNI